MPPSTAIYADSLVKQYGSTTAVRGVDLDVPAGCVYGFLGPNGAGKTTTMRMLTGLVTPSTGSAHVAGVDCTDRERLVEEIGLLPETPPLYEKLTGREQLQFAADLRGLDWETVADRSLSLCADLALRDDLDQRIEEYSKGMRQKAALVQALQHDPAVLFADEPTSNLDPRVSAMVRELLVDHAEDGTVFLSTHVLSLVEEVADTVGVLHEGRIVAEGPPEQLSTDVGGDLEDAFLSITGTPDPAPQ
ncbi:ABC transporter ATP-binding protein [Salinarchaeum laminariae]|uniref:ABC transporter ATP-binding protein n=1 Tax=Salinarchaeum laminariae TaxID=869888 RepID=UPI0020BD866F|nr:ABC transporter ATP-binding protein [Salinarchaeum laminariae]